MFVLELLGTPSLRNGDRPVPVAAQQRRSLGLVAILALAGKHGLSRDRVDAYLWPDSAAGSARHALDQTVYAIRHALGNDLIVSSGRELSLNPDLISVDLWEFEKSIHEREWEKAAARYKGSLLDGFHFGGSSELDSWIGAERARVLKEYQTAIEFVADCAAKTGDFSKSATWFRKLANSDPLSAGTTKKLMRALGAAGDRAGAVKHARLYQELVRQELDMEPDSDIEALAAGFSKPRRKEDVRPPPPNNAPSEHVLSTDLAPATAGSSAGRERIALYSVVPIAVLMSGAAIWGWMRPAASKPVARYALVVDSSEAIAKAKSSAGRLALSPDGSLLAYIGGRGKRLLIRPRNQLRAAAVPETDGVVTPFFSPDGGKVGFLREFKVEIASVDGGSPIEVSDTLTGVAGASWGPDGFIYVDGSGWTGLMRVEAKAGARPRWFTVLDTAGGEFDHTWPDVLPNGKGVLFTVSFKGRDVVNGKTSFAIAVADIATGKHRVIVPDAMFARYSSSGHLLYITTNKTLMIVPFDQASMTVTGKPTVLTEGMRLSFFGSADLAVSATGKLVYATGPGEGTYEVVWVTRTGETQLLDPDLKPAVFAGFPIISPDGKQLALAMDPTTAALSIWIKRLDREPAIRLTIDTADNAGPAWTPDGRSVTYSSDAGGGAWRLWTKRADGTSPAVLQAHEPRNLFGSHWSPDGKWLVFQSDPEQKGAGDILGMRPGIDSAPVPLIATNFSEVAPAISPDGRWLAYESNETGQYEVYVVPFPKMGPGKWAVSSAGGTEPLWSHTGKELFYRDGAGNLRAVKVKSKPTFSAAGSTVLFPAADFFALPFAAQYAVSPDDQRFVMVRTVGATTADKLIVVDNWFEELRGKVGHK